MAELDKDIFLSTVIHELRAPLNACLMSVNLLELKASQPEEVLRCVEVFRRNLDRQARLIQDLADVLQIVSGGIDLETERADLAALAVAAVERFRAGAGNAVDIQCTNGGAEVVVDADTDRIARVLDTLLEHQAAAAVPGQRLALGLETSGGRARMALRRIGAAAQGDDGPLRDQKGFAVRLAVAEQVLGAHGGRLERTDDGFAMELPLHGPG